MGFEQRVVDLAQVDGRVEEACEAALAVKADEGHRGDAHLGGAHLVRGRVRDRVRVRVRVGVRLRVRVRVRARVRASTPRRATR